MKRILIITALVFGLGITGLAAGTFSGSWAADISVTIPVQTPTIESVLTVNYTIAGWTFGSVSRLREIGWDRQDFRAGGALGAFTITNHLRFVPTPVSPAVLPAFTFLRSTAGVSIAGVDFSSRLLIVPAGSGVRLGFSAPVEDLTFAATAYFGSLAFDPPPWDPWRVVGEVTHIPEFRGIDIDLTIPFYSFALGIDVDFDPIFQDITFSVPWFSLGIPGLEGDFRVTYTLAAKAVRVRARIAVGEWLHFEPFFSVAVGPPAVGLNIEGLRLVWDMDPVTFTYEWDSRPSYPRVAGRELRPARPPWAWTEFQQRITIAYAEGPIGLTAAGRWLHLPEVRLYVDGVAVRVRDVHGVDVYEYVDGVSTAMYEYVLPVMPMFPEEIEADLSVEILPGFSLRTGVEFRAHVFHSISFGFTVEW